MKLDELARNAASQTRSAGQEMPLTPITTVQRRRRTHTVLIPALGVAAVWIVVVLVGMVPPTTAPVATTPTVAPTDDTIDAQPTVLQTAVVSNEELSGFVERTDSILPLDTEPSSSLSQPCCVAAGSSGDVLILEPNRVLAVTDQPRPLITWTDMEGRALISTTAGVVIAGTDASGASILRLYDLNGTEAWSLGLDFTFEKQPHLALGGEGIISLGVRDLFPPGSGFAPVQWFPVANLDGEPILEAQRSEARPIPDGRSIGLSEHSATLIDVNGRGTTWQIPTDLTVLSVDAHLDGVLVTAVSEPTAESGRLLVALLRPDAPADGFWLDRFWGPIPPGASMFAVTDQALFGLGANVEGAFLSLASLESLVPLAPFSLENVAWIGGDHQQITTDQSTVLARGTFGFPGRGAAWDGGDGVVALEEGELRWIRPQGETMVTVPIDEVLEIVDVVEVGGSHVVGLLEGSGVISWFDLATGDSADAPQEARTVDGLTFAAGGRRASVQLPDWTNVLSGEGGEPLPPFDLPSLVVTDEAGTELLRVSVGSTDRPFVRIHDFDGRRLIISATPFEPASPPQTVWILDLECADCTEVIETGHPMWFDLVGAAQTGGPTVVPVFEK